MESISRLILIIFLAVSTSPSSSSDLETRSIDVNSTALLSPLSLPDTYLRRGALPPKLDSSGRIKQDFRLQDFFWTGSGDSPVPSEPEDGGLAWEDGQDGVIRVTQTMTLYTTVVTTLYPVELTPTVVISSHGIPDSSPIILESSFSSSFPESSSSFIHSVSVETVSPTPTISVIPTATPSADGGPTTSPSPDAQPDLIGSASTNRLYWVNTVIKANGSKVNADLPEFQGPMQKNLARVYASAFKRHLLSSLGIMRKPDESGVTAIPSVRRRRRKRKRRSTNERHLEREDLDFEWMFLKEQGFTTSQIQSLATTAMNVSVAILNITSDPREPIVSMNYIVSAEGNPIPGSSAVQDLALVTKYEMEQEIGYEVITKAEALVTLPAHEEMSQTEKAESSPWLIVAIGAICAFVLSSVGLTYFAWKSKRSSISHDSPSPPPTAVLATRHQPGSIEGGVINPAFLGSPVRRSTGRTEQVLSETSQRKKEKREKKSSSELSGKIPPDSKQKERQKNLASELTTILTKTGKGEQILPSEVKTEAKSSSGSRSDKSSDSDRVPGTSRRTRKESEGKRGEDSASRKRRRRKTEIVEADVLATKSGQGDSRPGSKTEKDKDKEKEHLQQSQRPVSASSREKITFGHLDVYEDSGTVVHGKVKKSGSSKREDSSKDKRKSQSASSLMLPETIDEVTDLTTTEGAAAASQSREEQDREISESLEDYGSSSRTDSASPAKRDAQVQTPTRSRVKVKTKVKPKPAPRGTRPSKMTKETVYMSETEEVIDIDMDQFETSTDSNPLGRMRKRFHQFLDDAFNVMGKREGEDDEAEENRPKSAKVSISHEVETKDKPERPWTTHVIHEESLKQIRPKSAGIPKKAWADSAERRCHSAKSESSKHSQGPSGRSSSKGDAILERDERHEESDLSSTTVPTTTSTDIGRGHVTISTIPIFPHYPIYPDIPVLPSAQPGPSHLPSATDPAVPLIRAIKEEIKRFEKVKVKEEPYKGPDV